MDAGDWLERADAERERMNGNGSPYPRKWFELADEAGTYADPDGYEGRLSEWDLADVGKPGSRRTA